MSLDFSSFGDAISQLEKSLAYANSSMAKRGRWTFEQLRYKVDIVDWAATAEYFGEIIPKTSVVVKSADWHEDRRSESRPS